MFNIWQLIALCCFICKARSILQGIKYPLQYMLKSSKLKYLCPKNFILKTFGRREYKEMVNHHCCLTQIQGTSLSSSVATTAKGSKARLRMGEMEHPSKYKGQHVWKSKKYVSENVRNKQWLCGYWKLILLCMKCGKGRTAWRDREGRCNKIAEII